MKQIGVIGAGASGLCALRHILQRTDMKVIAWELSDRIGGTWVYTPRTGLDDNGLPIHSSMYLNLKTNLPKEVMAFPDFPFPKGRESFLPHSDVLKYLEEYASRFDLHPHIKFEESVESVEPVRSSGSATKWKVKTRKLKSGTSNTTICDGLLVCSGHYSTPKIAAIPGIGDFQGTVMHSHDYREPSIFQGKRVFVLGAGASGLDISIEISEVSPKVFLGHELPSKIVSKLPGNVHEVRGIKGATRTGFILNDDVICEVDAIVFCTGYEFTYPFLSPDCEVRVEDNQVKPLYKHVVHMKHKTMGFIGIPLQICPFPVFDFQVRYYLTVLAGETALPSIEKMEEENRLELLDRLEKGIPAYLFHKLGSLQWAYMDDLADAAAVPRLPKAIENLYTEVHGVRKRFLMTYKNCCYEIVDSEEFRTIT